MPTVTAITTLPGPEPAQALGAALEDLDPAPEGVGVFEIEDGSGLWEVGGYFTEPPDQVALAILAAAYGARDFAVSEVPETDWVAHVRRELAPVEAGRFVVYGSHDADRIPQGRVALLIEAAMAFGTGHHGTTKGCLLALEDLAAAGRTPARVADVGCGTAVLAMAAARVWPDAAVVASDIDPVAIDVARANLAANDMDDRVATLVAPGVHSPELFGPFDLVMANILMAPLVELAPDLGRIAAPGADVVLSGLLTTQADEVAAAYAAAGMPEVGRRHVEDWTTLHLRREPEDAPAA